MYIYEGHYLWGDHSYELVEEPELPHLLMKPLTTVLDTSLQQLHAQVRVRGIQVRGVQVRAGEGDTGEGR